MRIKKTVADIFGGLKKLQETIMRMLDKGKIVIAKMYDWLLPPEIPLHRPCLHVSQRQMCGDFVPVCT